jgi:peptidyl-prolyl cis-trans isomerase D
MSGKDFKQYQTDELVAARMRDLVRLPVRVSESEAWAQYELQKSRAVVRVAQLRWQWFARFISPVSEDAVTSYVNEHQAELLAAQQSKAELAQGRCRCVGFSTSHQTHPRASSCEGWRGDGGLGSARQAQRQIAAGSVRR